MNNYWRNRHCFEKLNENVTINVKFEGWLERSKRYFYFEDNWLKIDFKTRERMFTTCCFNNTFLVKTTPIKLYFMCSMEVQKKLI